MPLLAAAGHKTTPWKNGGGETTEIAVFPAGAGIDDFDWRVSMATIAADGAFSIFPGIDRILAIVEGAGVALRIGDNATVLTRASAPLSFAGDQPTLARLIAGPVRDLNVMTRRGRFTATVTRHVLSERLSLTCAGETLILCAAGAACIEVAEESFALAPGDAWRAAVSDAAVACIAAPAAVVYHIAIKAPAAAG